jgi:dihydropteroate synthase
MNWQSTRFSIDLSQPRVMGIVNVTPDSFSDGGRGAQQALAHAEQLLNEGADILDIGGESSRPGADPVPLDEELRRVLPVLRGALSLGVPVSVDTYKTEVMRAALDLGVDIINDIYALRATGAEQAVAAHPSCGVCLMHMVGEPKSMQADPQYQDVVAEVTQFLFQRAQVLRHRVWRPHASCLTRASALANASKTTSHSFAASTTSWRWVTRSWRAGRASPRWEP